MNQSKPKTFVRTRVSGVAESHSLTVLKTRDLVDVSDEPPERGGTNEGMAPTELFLASLVACSNVISHKIAKKTTSISYRSKSNWMPASIGLASRFRKKSNYRFPI